MTTQTVTLSDLKRNLGEIVNLASYGGQRIILLSRGKARAALIGMEDLHRLEASDQNRRNAYLEEQRSLLIEARLLREQMQAADQCTTSEEVLQEVREERVDDLLGMR